MVAGRVVARGRFLRERITRGDFAGERHGDGVVRGTKNLTRGETRGLETARNLRGSSGERWRVIPRGNLNKGVICL